MQMDRVLSLIDDSKDLRLLYVEDNSQVRTATLKLLYHFFHNITVCVNGEVGLETFNEKEFDLIITDIEMPVMSGMEMIEHIRLDDTTIPILVSSAQDEPLDLSLGINGYLTKPIEQAQFLDLLEHTVRYIIFKHRLNTQQYMDTQAVHSDTSHTYRHL